MNLNTAIQLSKVEFKAKYSHSILGVLWHLIMPIINYTTIIGIFKYIIYPNQPYWFYSHILAGLIIWNCFRDVTTFSCSMFLFKWNVIKDIKTSSANIIMSNHLSQYYTFFIHLIIYAIFIFLLVPVNINYIELILAAISFFMMTSLTGITLAFIGTLYNDIYYLWNAIGTLLFWSLPVLFLPDQVPAGLQKFLLVSPFYFPFLSFKQALIGQKLNLLTQVLSIIILGILLFIILKLVKKFKNKIINSL